MRIAAFPAWLLLALLLACGCAHRPSFGSAAYRLQVPRAKVAPQVSADPADPAWQFAPQVQQFTLALHSEPGDSPLPTRVALQWDADWLYIRFICTGPKPYAPFGNKRDGLHYKGDAVEIFCDPVGDGRQYFELQQSPVGGLLDQNTLLTTDAYSDAEGRILPIVFQRDYWPNLGYDMPGIRGAAQARQTGGQWEWIADFALPAAAVLKRKGLTHYEPMQLRLNLIRYHSVAPVGDPGWRLIAMNWAPVTWGCPHQSPAAMGFVTLVNTTAAQR